VCSGSGACTHPNNSAPCNDGLACNGADTCSGGACTVHAGDPCAGGPECANACDDHGGCFAPAGTACSNDGNLCTNDYCNGTGTCAHPNNTNTCDDNDACTDGDVCAGGACVSGDEIDCDDDNLCTNDSCDPTDGCLNVDEPSGPGSCLTAQGASFQLRDGAGTVRDSLGWKWQKGDSFDYASLGAPGGDDVYALCIYDSTAGVASLAGAVTIDPNAGWVGRDPHGYKYKDTAGFEDGVYKGQLKAGDPGRTSAQIRARGRNFPTPVPSGGAEFFDQDPVVTVELRSSTGMCWTSEFAPSSASENDAQGFKAKTP